MAVGRVAVCNNMSPNITIREVAHELGVSRASVYKFFSSRDELMEAFFDFES